LRELAFLLDVQVTKISALNSHAMPDMAFINRRIPLTNSNNAFAEATLVSSDIFANVDALRLSPDAAAVAGTSEVLSHVPIRKPNRQEFFRTHPNSETMWLSTGVFVDRQEREVFFVTPRMREALVGEIKPVLLITTVTRQSVLLLWPLTLPTDEIRRNNWFDTAREAAELAKANWVRMPADMSLGGYRIYQAQGQLSEPVWPEKTLSEILQIAFRDRIVDSENHPVVRRLRGVA
jgi:hypothetical protein